MRQARKDGRNGAIDGLRVLCIAAIAIYHLGLPWLPSGHMGVVAFLVIGGYLATCSVMRACERDGEPSLRVAKEAIQGRLLRLWPSVIAVLAVTGTLCGIFDHVLLTKMRPDILPSLGFGLNLSYIFGGTSYFDLIGGSSPLLHLWYLGCDMQFFVVWAVLLCLLLRGGRPLARRVALVLAVASAAWMAFLYVPGADPSRIYYGTDTRAFAMLVGSWLALAFPLGEMPAAGGRLLVRGAKGEHSSEPPRATALASLLGIASLAGMVAAMALVPAGADAWYLGGMLAFSVATVALLSTLLVPGSALGAVLGSAPLRVLGQRAFAMYLWHYPVFLLMGADGGGASWQLKLAAVGASLVAAELSLRLVERPFGHIMGRGEASRADGAAALASSLVALACGAYACYAVVAIPPEYLVPEDAIVSTGESAGAAMEVAAARTAAEGEGRPVDDEKAESVREPAGPPLPPRPEEPPAPVEVTDRTCVSAPPSEADAGLVDPLLIGDSVPGDAGDDAIPGGMGWQTRLPNAWIDTYIGRMPRQSLDVLRGYLDQGVVGKVVVMACFSNTTPTPETLDEMVAAVGEGRELYLVGTVNSDGFQDAANANLVAAAEAHENVHYVDWPVVLDGRFRELLWADATHLRPEGARAYVDMVVRAVAQDIVDEGGATTER